MADKTVTISATPTSNGNIGVIECCLCESDNILAISIKSVISNLEAINFNDSHTLSPKSFADIASDLTKINDRERDIMFANI